LALNSYLNAHLTQLKDNHSLRSQEIFGAPSLPCTKIHESSHQSFHTWTRYVSGEHTAGPLAFSLLVCLLSNGDGDCLPSAQAKYIGQDLSRHLAALCRLYNDWGSFDRDREENNLNSINFPEFAENNDQLGLNLVRDDVLKERLFYIAEYERRCLEASLAELGKVVKREIYDAFKVFCQTADMYGQMYVLKDLTPKIIERKDREREKSGI